SDHPRIVPSLPTDRKLLCRTQIIFPPHIVRLLANYAGLCGLFYLGLARFSLTMQRLCLSERAWDYNRYCRFDFDHHDGRGSWCATGCLDVKLAVWATSRTWYSPNTAGHQQYRWIS